ncbi:MAG: tetratricopeptide repeat protein, partial [Lentisphaeria bacterium]
ASNSEISKQEIAMAAAKREIPVRQRRIDVAKTEFERSQTEINLSRSVVEKVEKEIEEIRKLLDSPDERERVKAQADIVDKQDELRPARLRVKKAEDRIEAAQMRILVESRRDQQIIDESTKLIELAEQSIEGEKRKISLNELYVVYLKSSQKAVASRLEKAKADEQLYTATAKGDGKEETQTVVKKANKAKEDYQAAFKDQLAYFAQIAKFNTIDHDMAMKSVEAYNAEIAKKELLIQPLKADGDKAKRDAIVYFDKFLKLYPKSADHTARNLAFAGKIYIGFAEFEKAAVYLNQLKKDYPNSDFIKNATFDIAESYLKIKRYKEAIKSYQEILSDQKAYSPGQLTMMQRQLVESGIEAKGDDAKTILELAIKIGDTLLNRLEQVKTREPRLWAARELVIYRNAEAAFELKDYEKAIKYYNQVLVINPRSAYQFRINFKLGICLREKSPADILGSLTAFNQIVRYKDNAGLELYTMTILEQAKTEMARNSFVGCNNAANTLRLIVMAFDKEDSTISQYVQQAYYDLVQALALMGNLEEANKYVAEYKISFPQGIYSSKIANLPAVKFQAPKN